MDGSSVRKASSSLIAATAALAMAASSLAAQVGTVTGTVTDANTGEPIATVQVHIPDLQLGMLTNADGAYALPNVPVGQYEIRAELIGRQTDAQVIDVTSGAPVVANFMLESRVLAMDAVVVTGVAGATPETELAFTVEQVEVETAQIASALNVASLLQGRTAGTRVIQGTGQPGDEPSVQFRGPTSIMQSQAPLLIVDGVISTGSLADIDPNDIQNIEIVRGAAAASLYGSRAQAGVMEVTTRRGAALREGTHEFTIRSQYQFNDIEYVMGLTESHEYRMNAAGTAILDRNGNELDLHNRNQQLSTGSYALNDNFGRPGGAGRDQWTTFQDQPIPPNLYGGSVWDHMLSSGNSYNTYVSASGNEGSTQYRASAAYQRDEGVMQFHNGAEQTNVRLNLDQSVGDQLQFSLSSYVTLREQDVIFQQERIGLSNLTDLVGYEPRDPTASGGTARRGLFLGSDHYRAGTDLFSRDEDGDLHVIGDLISRRTNPFYQLENQDWTRDRLRVMGAMDAQYSPFSWLSFQGNLSYDRTNLKEVNITPSPWKRAYPRPPLDGAMFRLEDLREELNGNLTASIQHSFGDLTMRTRFRWLAEQTSSDNFVAGGSTFSVVGVPQMGLLTTGLYTRSHAETVRSQGLFAITALTYRSKYILDLLARRDGSSLFGPDERWQNYYRVSAAWRMAEEEWFPLDFFTEFRPRYSRGTAGGRPGFSYQYQTYAVDRGRIIPKLLGNSGLKPELATEQEYGIDMMLVDRYRVQLNYVDLEVRDQLLLVPLSSALGFESQWRNAGTVASTTWEASIEAAFVERPDLVWTARLNLDRTRQEITELNVPPFEFRDLRARMMVREGEELGAFYGSNWLRSCSELPGGMDCNQFDVNDDGLLVYVGAGNDYRDGAAKSLWGTTGNVDGTTLDWGMPIKHNRFDNTPRPLGSSQPDLNVSFLQDFQFRNMGVTLLFEGEFGAQIMNQTRQWGSRSGVGAIDQRGKPEELKKPLPYYGAAFLYDRNNRNDWYVEDGDFIKLRELSVRYTFDQSNLPGLLAQIGFERATVNL
ncbi:MAG: SusC/RagA family TonB-linked outer membrane protein, partial [Acidobacteria bacterium]|nr:SusC/RagA family TonB-linked outer membrane protein [Acidobacteriota bacterium]